MHRNTDAPEGSFEALGAGVGTLGTLDMLGVAALGAWLAACEPTQRLRCI